jgi:hypothetical protein
LGEEAAVVCGPDHGGEGGGVGVVCEGVLAVNDGGLGCGKVSWVYAAGSEGPEWGAGATGEA